MSPWARGSGALDDPAGAFYRRPMDLPIQPAILDAPAAHDHGDGGGCATAGGAWGTALAALGAMAGLAARRRRR